MFQQNKVKKPVLKSGESAPNAPARTVKQAMPQDGAHLGLPVYDEGGEVKTANDNKDKKDDSVLGKVKDYAVNLYNEGKALIAPLDSEKDAFDEKSKNLVQYDNATKSPLGSV